MLTCRHSGVGLTLILSLALAGCAAEQDAAKPGGTRSPDVEQRQERSPEPETAGDFLDLAEEAMAGESGWTFAVRGEERLTLQGQENTASFEATLRRSQNPEALHSEGKVTDEDGASQTEEVYVVRGMAHVKEGDEGWREGPTSDPEMKNKIEDPVAAVERFRGYLKDGGDAVALTRTDGTIRLRVGIGSQQLSAVRDRGFVARAVREFEPTADQLRQAGVAVDEAQLTVSGLEETLVLDAERYRITSHRFAFGLLIPYGGDEIAYRQDVREENQGVFDGKIQLPAGVA